MDNEPLNKATVGQLIIELQEQCKLIPQDDLTMREIVHKFLVVVEAYASWVEGLKGEIIKMDRMIQVKDDIFKKVYSDKPRIILPDIAS